MTADFTLRPKPGAVKWRTMCANYTPTARDWLKAARLGVAHLLSEDWPPETFPGYEVPIVVRGGVSGERGDAPRRMHHPGDEKRMPLIIPPGNYEAWLHAKPEEAQAMMRMPAPQELVGEPAPNEAGRKTVAHNPAMATVANLPLF